MGKAVWVTGYDNLEKLEQTCGKIKFQFVVPRAKISGNGSMILTSSDPNNGPAIVKGTPDFLIICRLNPGEHPPADLATVKLAKI